MRISAAVEALQKAWSVHAQRPKPQEAAIRTFTSNKPRAVTRGRPRKARDERDD